MTQFMHACLIKPDERWRLRQMSACELHCTLTVEVYVKISHLKNIVKLNFLVSYNPPTAPASLYLLHGYF